MKRPGTGGFPALCFFSLGGEQMYLALYRKYRPKTFEDVLSQPHITETLKNEITNNRTAHAYLFTGPRGTGKTTCAKILAMAVNCENPQNGNPCFECESCRAIESGATLDVVEIDAASNNGVDNIRDLRDEANYTPSLCRYRVYIIDETHMLSAGAFNALLKIMEEPPEHVKFILATTEAHKVPATILSRCQRFDFRRIKALDIKSRLLQVAGLEELHLEENAAELIARLADGGMRDALSLLDHCAGFSSEITLDSAIQTIGLVDRNYLFDLTDCILSQDASMAIQQIDRLYSMSKDMQALLEELLNHFRNLMLMMTLKNPDELIAVLPEELERLRDYSKKLTLPAVLHTLGELQDCVDKMGRNFDRRMTLELCLVKLCTPSMDTRSDALSARISRLEAILKNGVIPSVTSSSKSAEEGEPAPAEEILPPDSEPQMKETVPIAEPPFRLVSPVSGQTDSEIRPLEEWPDILMELAKTDTPLYGVLKDSRAFVGGGFLYIDSLLSITGIMMKQEGNAARLIAAVENRTGMRYKIRVKSAPQSSGGENKLSSIMEKARQSGIEVREE